MPILPMPTETPVRPSVQTPHTNSFHPNPPNLLFSSPMAMSPVPMVEPLLIDNLAHDFQLEAVQRANLHAFLQVLKFHLFFVGVAYLLIHNTRLDYNC